MFYKNAWVVADRDYWPLLLQAKEKEPNCNFKLLTKEDLLDRLTIVYQSDPVPLLMKGCNLDFLQAKKWANLLRVLWDSNSSLIQEKKNIVKECVREALPISSLKKNGVVLFECEEDEEIQRILKNKGIPYVLSSFDDIGLDAKWDGKTQKEVLSFQNKFQQYFYLFSEIRKSLLSNPEISKNILIHVKDEADLFYLRLASDNFNIPVRVSIKTGYLSNPSVSAKLDEIHKKRNFEFSDEEKENEDLAYLCQAISKYGLNEMDFDVAYANLLEILGGAGSVLKLSDSGISATSNFLFSSKSIIYVTDFIYGSFHQVYDDKNVLPDKDLIKLGANPSYVKTALDKRKKWNYLKYLNIVSLSRVREHLSDSIYDSQFVENTAKDKTFAITKKCINNEGVYSEKAKKLMHAFFCDRHYGHVNSFDGYDSFTGKFTGISDWKFSSDFSWSVSTLKSYRRCPFYFYLTKILGIKDETDSHFRYLGTLLHKIMENAYSKDFDYEKAFQDGVEAYKNEVNSKGDTFTTHDEASIELYHDGFKKIVERMLTWMEVSSIKDYSSEKRVYWTIEDNGKTYNFNGSIDKIVYFEKDNSKYYFLIDYKTGSGEAFAPTYVYQGFCLQLPLYAIAMEEGHSKDEKDLTRGFKFGGFGIQELYFTSNKKAFTKDKPNVMDERSVVKNTAIKGIAIKDRNFWDVADNDDTVYKKPNDKTGECECTYSGLYINGDATFDPKSGCFSGRSFDTLDPYYSWADMKNDATKAALEIIHHIEHGDFPIAPTTSKPGEAIKNENLTCSNCPYKDVCYRDFRDLNSIVNTKQRMNSHFKMDKRNKEAEKEREAS